MKKKGLPGYISVVWASVFALLVPCSVVRASETQAAGGDPEWGVLAIESPVTACGFVPGDTVIMTIRVSELLSPINGVQALIRFDADALTLDGIQAGDGAGSAWDGAGLLSDIDGRVVNLGVILFGSSTGGDGIVARLTFTALFGGADLLADVAMVELDGVLSSRLTLAADGSTVLPALVTPASISHGGDDEPDGDIDLFDLSAFLGCVTGPDSDQPLGDCCRFDFDRDDDVDLSDYGRFGLLFTGQIGP